MSKTELTTRQKVAVGGVVLAGLAAVLATGLLLQEHGPGNMGTGFLQGAAVGLVGCAVVIWRISKRPDRATTFERAWTQTGDERDDALLTRALAVLGLLAFPLTGAAAIAVGVGADVAMIFFLLLTAEVVTFVAAWFYISRRT